MAILASRRGAVLLTRRFPDLMVGVAGNREVQAIVKSNGWSEGTAALQLFAHLDGEALNVALLIPVAERDKWKDLSNGLLDYYNSPGRLAATFATELGILAVHGFGDMGKRARDSMVRDKCIAAQRNCGI